MEKKGKASTFNIHLKVHSSKLRLSKCAGVLYAVFVWQVRNCTTEGGSTTLASQHHLIRLCAAVSRHKTDLFPRLPLQAPSSSPYGTGQCASADPVLPSRAGPLPTVMDPDRRQPVAFPSCIAVLRESSSTFPSSGRSH